MRGESGRHVFMSGGIPTSAPMTLDDMNVYIMYGYPDSRILQTQQGARTLDDQIALTYKRFSDPTKLIVCSPTEQTALDSYNKVMGYMLSSKHTK